MTEQELMPLKALIEQWDEEMPLLAVDTILRQVLSHVQEGQAERAKLLKRVDTLTIEVAALRSQSKQSQKGDEFDVHL